MKYLLPFFICLFIYLLKDNQIFLFFINHIGLSFLFQNLKSQVVSVQTRQEYFFNVHLTEVCSLQTVTGRPGQPPA